MFSFDQNSQVLTSHQSDMKSFNNLVYTKNSSHTLRAYLNDNENSYGAPAQACSDKSALSYMDFLGSNDSPADFQNNKG